MIAVIWYMMPSYLVSDWCRLGLWHTSSCPQTRPWSQLQQQGSPPVCENTAIIPTLKEDVKLRNSEAPTPLPLPKYALAIMLGWKFGNYLFLLIPLVSNIFNVLNLYQNIRLFSLDDILWLSQLVIDQSLAHRYPDHSTAGEQSSTVRDCNFPIHHHHFSRTSGEHSWPMTSRFCHISRRGCWQEESSW